MVMIKRMNTKNAQPLVFIVQTNLFTKPRILQISLLCNHNKINSVRRSSVSCFIIQQMYVFLTTFA